jgi:hypothetical protein
MESASPQIAPRRNLSNYEITPLFQARDVPFADGMEQADLRATSFRFMRELPEDQRRC